MYNIFCKAKCPYETHFECLSSIHSSIDLFNRFAKAFQLHPLFQSNNQINSIKDFSKEKFHTEFHIENASIRMFSSVRSSATELEDPPMNKNDFAKVFETN